ncbi:MAG: sugar-binding transcriptional regulator [Bauldia sp.]|uniref:sugar-binding transcriptional regulator n=1 Tax=Bauldia sp. TaxID=2575872 RepID=UPI001D1B3C49|nr:sugar-binding transcriptional regulator [Bauldia sp.]MCB1497350.1 sugar-binding transcriptional regulator [Bauldia sp.]
MARLKRLGQPVVSEDNDLRIRAAWLYHSQGLTQKEVAERLGVSRGTVIRLLNEAAERGDVQIWINESESACVALASQLEQVFDLDEAIVVPGASGDAAARSVGIALGQFLSQVVTEDMTVGVGWGRTLTASLTSLRPARRSGVKIVSLLGGMVEARDSNPLEFSWRMATRFGADCYLFVAPAFVDSAETRTRLIEKCGLDRILELAKSLDIAVLSVGDIGRESTSLSASMVTGEELGEVVAKGAVSDVLCNFLDRDGRSVDHPLNERVMSIDLDRLRKAGHLVIATGGAHRAVAIAAAISRIGCNTLVTDETAAAALLDLKAG